MACFHSQIGHQIILSYLICYRSSFYTEDYWVLRLSMVYVKSCIFIRVLNVDKVLVFLVPSDNTFLRIPDGKNENLYEFVLAYGLRNVFLFLSLTEGWIKLSFCCISKLELIALCIIITLLLVLLSASIFKFNIQNLQINSYMFIKNWKTMG